MIENIKIHEVVIFYLVFVIVVKSYINSKRINNI